MPPHATDSCAHSQGDAALRPRDHPRSETGARTPLPCGPRDLARSECRDSLRTPGRPALAEHRVLRRTALRGGHVDQLAAEQLAADVARELVGEDDLGRALVPGEVVEAPVDQLLLV